MSLKCIKVKMVTAAKEKLAQHKNLGNRSNLSIIQVAILLDIVSGHTKPESFSSVYNDQAFSLN